jgi:hypothetical protein
VDQKKKTPKNSFCFFLDFFFFFLSFPSLPLVTTMTRGLALTAAGLVALVAGTAASAERVAVGDDALDFLGEDAANDLDLALDAYADDGDEEGAAVFDDDDDDELDDQVADEDDGDDEEEEAYGADDANDDDDEADARADEADDQATTALLALGGGTLRRRRGGPDMGNFASQLNMMSAQMAHAAAMCRVNPQACGLGATGAPDVHQNYGYNLRTAGLGGIFPDPAALRHQLTGSPALGTVGATASGSDDVANNPLHTPHWYGRYPSYMDPKLARAFEDMRRDDRKQWRVGGEPFSVLDGGKENPVLPHGLRLASAMPKNTYPDPGFYPQYYRLSSGGF